jgi:hypothetical protein
MIFKKQYLERLYLMMIFVKFKITEWGGGDGGGEGGVERGRSTRVLWGVFAEWPIFPREVNEP